MTETEHYRAHGYVALKALFPTELLSAFYGRMTDDLAAAGRSMASFKTRGPLQRDEAIEIYAYQYAPMLAFLWGVTPRMAQLTGLGLLPTYAYFRAYRVGDVCRVHSDRPACEHSLSLTLASGEDRPWSLSVATGRTDQPRPIVSDDFEGAAFESVDCSPVTASPIKAPTIATAGSIPTPTAGRSTCSCTGSNRAAAMPTRHSTGQPCKRPE